MVREEVVSSILGIFTFFDYIASRESGLSITGKVYGTKFTSKRVYKIDLFESLLFHTR
jgi:hypothetical protein